ncbi:MAG TPA: adenylate/guanylate cyclase domain-containing protein [Acidimicrobiales bacterium]|nr:adenylate/guanylate cyclase domain-containing protein [Acidimicrobiales bacterium]
MNPELAAPRGPREVYRTVAWQTAVRVAFANLGGAAVVFSYVQYAEPSRGADTTHRYFLVLVAYLGLVAPIIVFGALRAARPIEQWIEADRAPTPAEKVAVLDQPYVQTRVTFRAWIGAAVLFTVVNAVNDVPLVETVRIAIGIVLGGGTTSALCFLLVERMHRPAFALALSDGILPERHGIQVRSRLLIMWALSSGVPFLGIMLSPRAGAQSVALAGIGLGVGFGLTEIVARSVTDPLDELREGLDRVAGGDLDAQIPVDDGGELGALEAGYNRMLEGLRERDRLADLFGRHVGVEVARRAIEQGVALGGSLREMSILFVDMIGSTTLATRRAPSEVVELLNTFFGAIVTVIEDNHGSINRFDGDGALCTFGALEEDVLHATNALTAARELAAALRVLGAQYPEIAAGIGVSSGTAVAGNIGARQRVEYTVIGDPVNEASRLTDLAKGYSSGVLASSKSIFSAIVAEQDRWDYVGSIALRGREEATETYEPALASEICTIGA